MAGLAKIDKRVSFHTARHTNATLLLYNGANITTVQKLLGHKSVKTTQVYANIMDITVVRDLEKTASSKNNNKHKTKRKCSVLRFGYRNGRYNFL